MGLTVVLVFVRLSFTPFKLRLTPLSYTFIYTLNLFDNLLTPIVRFQFYIRIRLTYLLNRCGSLDPPIVLIYVYVELISFPYTFVWVAPARYAGTHPTRDHGNLTFIILYLYYIFIIRIIYTYILYVLVYE